MFFYHWIISLHLKLQLLSWEKLNFKQMSSDAMLLTGKAANTHFWLRILLLHFWSEGSLAVQIQDGSAVPSCAINQSQIYSYKQTLQQEINFLICRSYVRKQLLSWAQHTETAGYFVSVSVGTDTTMFSFAFRDYTLTDFSFFCHPFISPRTSTALGIAI